MDGLALKAAKVTDASLVARAVLIALAQLADDDTRRVETTYADLAEVAGTSLTGAKKGVTDLVSRGLVKKLTPGRGPRPMTYELMLT